MTGVDLRRIRHRVGMGVARFGRELGVKPNGADDTIAREVRRLEARRGQLPAGISLAALRLEDVVDKKRKAGLT